MAIKIKKGNYFNSKCGILVNTVNCVGVMGAGVALLHKNKYPEQFEVYKHMCKNNRIKIGKLYFWRGTTLGYDKDVLLFPTKVHWRNISKLQFIEIGLKTFVNSYKDFDITSIAFPKLGCNNGGLDWRDVKPLMIKYLGKLPIDIEIWE